MIQGILEGRVDCIATDHAPHACHEKEQEFERAPNGITGLETALGLTLSVLHKQHGMPLPTLLAMLTHRPAQLLSLQGRGTLAVGSYADVVLFDPNEKWTFDAKDSRSKSKNTPFDGYPMQGRVHTTISEGRIVFQR
jgi:dihydroorotase